MDAGLMNGGGLGHQGDAVKGCGRLPHRSPVHKIFDVQVLRGQDPVERGETELAFSMQKIRDMRRIEACLPRKQRPGKRAALNAAQQFAAELLV